MSTPGWPRGPTADQDLLPCAAATAVADELVAAVHAGQPARVAVAIQRARRDLYELDERGGAGDGADPLVALAVLLAAAVPDDVPIGEHLTWLSDPPRYRRLRHAGTAAATACALIADDLHRQHRQEGGPA